MVVIWSNPAIDDLKKFKEITKKTEPDEYLSNLVTYVEDLSLNPRLGKIYIYIQETIIRQLIYKEHKIYYYIEKNDKIHILAVVHSKENTKQRISYIKNNFKNK